MNGSSEWWTWPVLALAAAGSGVVISMALDLAQRIRGRRGSPQRVEDVRISPWRALPGGRLALGASGVEIVHTPHDPEADYVLIHPDGRRLGRATAGYLQLLKEHGEAVAEELAQFDDVETFPAVFHGANRDR